MDSLATILNFLLILLCIISINCRTVSESRSQYSKTCATKTDCSDFSEKEYGFNLEEARKKEEDLMSKILPMMVMPFMVQTTLLPIMLMSMKFMLMKGAFLGKLAIFLSAVTLLRNHLKQGGGLYSHNINIAPKSHHHDLKHQNYGIESSNTMPHSIRKKKRRK